MAQDPSPRRGPALDAPPDAIWVTIAQTCHKTQLSRPSVVALIASGQLAAIRVGRHWRISAASLDALIGSQGKRIAS